MTRFKPHLPQPPYLTLPRPFTQQERVRLLWDDLAGYTPLGMRDHAIVALLLDTGLRGRELCALTLDAVCDRGRDEECRTLLVRSAKDGRERKVQLGPTASIALWQYLHDARCRPRHGRDTERALFVMENGQPLDRWLLHEIVRAAGERARLDDQPLTVHRLRLRVFAERWAAYLRDHGAGEDEASGSSGIDDRATGGLE